MITNLHLNNFKCFVNQDVTLGKLTVLSGPNGSGKSSVLQSFLLAKFAASIGKKEGFVPLNEPHLLELGAVGDVLSQAPTGNKIEITVATDSKTMTTVSADASPSKLEDRFLTVRVEGDPFPNALKANEGFDFIFLSAERLGPRDSHATQSRPLCSMSLGYRGEYCAEILAKFERKEVQKMLAHPSQVSETPPLLRQQAELWMGEWAPKIQLRAEAFPDTNVSSLRFLRRDVQSEWMRPGNVGFGISHSLPIVLGGLLANPGGLVIIDSPESHLHPSGQSAIGRFLVSVASAGIQVIVETHSDHVLNGIRIGVAKKINGITPADVSIYNIASGEAACSSVESIEITSTANLSHWPTGFCDQIERDLAELSKLRKAK